MYKDYWNYLSILASREFNIDRFMRKTRNLLLIIFCAFAGFTQAADLRGDTIDVRGYQLRLDLSDFTNKVLYGDATIGIKAKMNNVGGIHLDLLGLTVDSVFVNAVKLPFTYNDSIIDIHFPNALNTGDSATLRIYYNGSPLQMAGDFGGFFWTATYAFNIGVSFLADPPCFGKVWFPCFDNFTVRSNFEYYITTDITKKAFCNGLLLDSSSNATTNTWHWKLKENIPSYLASVTVGPYVTLADTVNTANGNIPIQIGAAVSDTASVKHLFQHLHDDVHNLEKHWGPYRWERVGYCIVPFDAGALEHATNISFMQYFLNLVDNECEQVVAHELSHHWFGDLVTCPSAAEMWLNEGWASFNENLFFEDVYGADSAKKVLRVNHQLVQQMAHVNDGAFLPVSGVPEDQTYGTTVYKKGEDVIHTLRYYMGDSLFFSSVRDYLNHYTFQHGSTFELRDYLSQQSGIDLTDYFDDWILAPGFPHFSIEHQEIQAAGGSYTLHYQVRQRLREAPHHYNNVPVTVSYFREDMSHVDERITVSGECTDHITTLAFQPVYVAVDFNENLQDAISDEWQIIKTPGTYNYTIGMMKVRVNSVGDSALLRIEHNWIAADAMYNPIPDLHLHNYRYWTIGGVFDSTFNAQATITYDGSPTGNLDSSFISNSEDSLVMMYRPNQDSDWAFADSILLNVQVNVNNKKGLITIYNLKKGEYAMAIYNTNLPTDTNKRASCKLQVNVAEITSPKNFKLYPNPSSGNMIVDFDINTFDKLEVFDLLGKKLMEQKIASVQNITELKLSHIAAGSYLVTLSDKLGNRYTKKMIKE
ncbi:MAG: hypothetical protein JWO06_3085 [Bacteroidota bacterium]|nr:hypothetical protein [Bacteroidota bacterium]